MFYLTRLHCPKKNKKYIIPTKEWLIPIEKFISQDISTKGKFFIADLLKQEKILVKITKGKNYDLKHLNKILKNEPNMVFTYCTFFCNENVDDILDNKEFCNGKDSSTLELMYYYKRGSLNKYHKKFNKNKIKEILQQLIYSQLNIFQNYGLTHNDIHLGNILIQKYKIPKLLDYKYINIQLSNIYEYILSDYDLMISFHPTDIKKYKNIFTLDEYFTFSLFSNIITTINIINKLSSTKLNLFDIQNKYENDISSKIKQNIKLYFNDKITFQKFIKNEIKIIIPFINELILL